MSVRPSPEVACGEVFGMLGYGQHLGSFMRANILHNWTTGVEATPGRGIDRAGYISLEDDLFALEVGIRKANGAQLSAVSCRHNRSFRHPSAAGREEDANISLLQLHQSDD